MEQINRIIFLFLTKFSKRDYQRFGCDIIKKKGYEVEVWECAPWLYPVYSQRYDVSDPCDFSGHKVFGTFEATKAAISALTEKDVIVDVWHITKEYDFGMINGSKVGTTLCGSLPERAVNKTQQFSLPERAVNKTQQFIRRMHSAFSNPLHIFSIVKSRFFQKLRANAPLSYSGNPAYDFMIVGGTGVEKHREHTIDDTTTILKAHAFDYDRYLEEEMDAGCRPFQSAEPYAVFLDQAVGFHPEINISNVMQYPTLDQYYPEIRNFFMQFTAQTGLQVVIATHPRIDNSSQGKLFGGSVRIAGKTVSLVKRSQLVLAHATTAINFAVLYHKPVILLDSENFDPHFKSLITAFERALGAHTINMSHAPSVTVNDFDVDERKYSLYKNRFIKEPGTPEKFVWDVFCDYLNVLNA